MKRIHRVVEPRRLDRVRAGVIIVRDHPTANNALNHRYLRGVLLFNVTVLSILVPVEATVRE